MPSKITPARPSRFVGAGSSIRVASELTTIPLGTLRAWERRYGFPKPTRRAGGNRRSYSPDQIEHLKVVASALERGFRPSDVIHVPLQDLRALLEEQERVQSFKNPGRGLADVASLLSLLRNDDVKALEDELRLMAAALGAKRFITDLAEPLLQAVGQAWADGKLAIRQEHLLTECLTTQLRALLATHLIVDGEPIIVLATLPGEPHTLGLQMVALYLALSGAKPRLLGASTPPAQVASAAKALQASVVGIAVSPASDLVVARRDLRSLARELPASTLLWVGGSGSALLGRLPAAAVSLVSWSAIDAALRRARRVA